MLKTIVIAVLVFVAGILAYAATKPDTFRVQRTTGIKAPPEKIFPLLDDFHRWSVWSPFEKMDPAMKRSFSGAASGKGAVYAWESPGKVGVGGMEITQSSPPSRVVIDLYFKKPFESRNVAVFTLEPKGDMTNVTWSMEGPNPYIAKLMQVFFDAENMVGSDFEKGLADLKAAVEK